jgi:programmed cell death protein 5
MAINAEDELTQIREQRRIELQQQLEQQAAAQAEAEIDAQTEMQKSQALDAAMKTVLAPEARSRLASLNLVNPEICTKVKSYLASLANDNKIQIPVSDDQLKQILVGLNQQKRETSIRRL